MRRSAGHVVARGFFADDALVYHAFAGERNIVSAHFDRLGEGTWTISDPGAVIVAREPCRGVDAHTITCTSEPGRFIEFARFELDDRFRSGSSRVDGEAFGNVVVFSGPGDDDVAGDSDVNVFYGETGNDVLSAPTVFGAEGSVLKGGAGDDRLMGGPGFDELDGGGGRDELFGGDGEDLMTDGDRDGALGDAAPGPDLIDGGAGDCCLSYGGDRVIYAERTAPVHVDLTDPRTDGEAGEGDTLIDVESVEGGSGNDWLLGDDADNALFGRRGRDRLTGRGGHDAVRSGSGGGTISCGTSLDIAEAFSEDHVAADCENLDGQRVGIYGVVPAYRRKRRSGELGYRVSCPHRNEDDGGPVVELCSGSVQIRALTRARLLLAYGAVAAGRWSAKSITVHLTRAGKRLATRRQGVRANVRVRLRNNDGGATRTVAMRWRIQFILRR